MRILITGGTGFVGKCLFSSLAGHTLVSLGRSEVVSQAGIEHHKTDFGPNADYSESLQGVDVVVHCASVINADEKTADARAAKTYDFNVRVTSQLASQALAAGVKKFIYLSSAKVNGESTFSGAPFRETDEPSPAGEYAISKYRAEAELETIFGSQETSLIILRPPLVYGEEVKGNFRSMISLARLPLPLPFLLFSQNKRSMIYVGNLVDFIERCIEVDGVGGIYFIDDGEAYSTSEMLLSIYKALGVRSKLFPFPALLLRILLTVLGMRGVYERLHSSLELDSSLARTKLGWTPPFTVADGVQRTINSYIEQVSNK